MDNCHNCIAVKWDSSLKRLTVNGKEAEDGHPHYSSLSVHRRIGRLASDKGRLWKGKKFFIQSTDSI